MLEIAKSMPVASYWTVSELYKNIARSYAVHFLQDDLVCDFVGIALPFQHDCSYMP